jgi:hypothetical protein
MPNGGSTLATGNRSAQRLFVALNVEMRDDHPCPLSCFDESFEDIRHQVGQELCHIDAQITDSSCECTNNFTSIEHIETRIEPDCACPVFVKYGCIPQVTENDDSTLTIKTYLPDRELLNDLITGLKSVVENVSVWRLKRIDTQDDGNRQKFVTLDLYELTQKQRQAITTAVAAGYYETPREVSLGEIADRLDITKSALSQRLKAAESKLVTSAFSRGSITK